MAPRAGFVNRTLPGARREQGKPMRGKRLLEPFDSPASGARIVVRGGTPGRLMRGWISLSPHSADAAGGRSAPGRVPRFTVKGGERVGGSNRRR
jgi:hypothetical protein